MDTSYAGQAAALRRHLEILPLRDRAAQLAPELVEPGLADMLLDQAARFARDVLEPLAPDLDRGAVTVEGGRVRTSAAYREAWQSFAAMGWLGMAAPAPHGQGLPLPFVTACEELFNRGSAAFTMLATPGRTGATLLLECAAPALREQWVPHLLDGSWAATICISEPDAGSDVGRIRTRARADGDRWLVSGEKCWISFGDHDLASRIGHLMLARSLDAPGARGLSLFLVPSTHTDGSPNGVRLHRVEEKLGLHGSPTCVLGFAEAEAQLIGPEGRGLQQMFRMMLLMRLSCGPQGSGVASAALDTAWGYARDRRQGGRPDQPPLPLVAHADVQRQLLAMMARVELARGLNLITALVMELADRTAEPAEREELLALVQFLLPLVKDGGAWAAFDVASGALQVLGGAGYTSEWPVERHLRDARVFPVFEGTTGIQAIDLVHRRLWKDRASGITAFLAMARADSADCPELSAALDRLERTVRALRDWESDPRNAEAGATAFLDLCTACAHGWVAARIQRLAGDDDTGTSMAAAAQFHLAELDAHSARMAQLATLGADRLTPLARAAGLTP
ncbi:acyl-CoA dehydrogenase family protein [Novosphingobium piscinae]|uniref:Acyl-CoA dehydrogenase family protein n=1 Tax=Novosphingobium piscinae TaxID=1507448 RepID=A0A7X1FVR0_9SPHN|nr:acyl-CoA dehydrogenase family protein [Novosphingobium piscinae]MBC2667879.1 acyl-CoA dehydrogenase family protein [Novosphingobium piscinae]